MKKLQDILKNIPLLSIIGKTDIEINNIHFDSRAIKPGDLFVAQKGVNCDGHQYIDTAIKNGAIAIVCNYTEKDTHTNKAISTTYIYVTDTTAALGLLAANYYNNPSTEIKLCGITGTNGKTTTATLLYDLARALGHKAGLLSTVINKIDNESITATHTTPDILTINKLLRQMVDVGCEYCFMEVSSHAIHQNRIANLNFDGAIFSNITHDHLNYHITFKEYIKAKKLFFDRLPKNAFALSNLDDKNGTVMLQNCISKHYYYSCRTLTDFNCKIIEKHLDGMLISLNETELWVKFTGDFNAYNLLSVYATATLLGMNKEKVLQAMSLLTPVSGRFETIISTTGIMAIIDYAHTPDALANVLSTIRPLLHKSNKLTAIVGAGGDRDKTKRPEMAKIACELSDYVILTSDNPRTEAPEQIIHDMQEGVSQEHQPTTTAIIDRKEAIIHALSSSTKGDIVLIAGKGHEDYQEINGIKHHFDDREQVKNYFKETEIATN